MDLYSLLGLSVAGAALATLLRQYKPEFAMAVSLVLGAFIFMSVIINMTPVFDTLKELGERVSDNRYVSAVIKCLGVCYLTSLASDICRDTGQTAIASKVELAGKVSILLLSLPLFNELISIILDLVNL
ncbi:MAG: stage III sporulation AC/AD family protein [Oscillospiraceae bacterium]|nr:stage III sporulation AC/AD family protein [Oscillospiraceae bacterium]